METKPKLAELHQSSFDKASLEEVHQSKTMNAAPAQLERTTPNSSPPLPLPSNPSQLPVSIQQLIKTVELLNEGITLFDRQGNLQLMNQAARALFEGNGRTAKPEHLADFKIYDLRKPDGTNLAEEEWPATRAIAGESFEDILLLITSGQGQDRRLRCSGFAITDEAGEVERAVVVYRDVTQEYEENRLKDLFISIVSHELRTPLTSIKGYSQLLERNLTKRQATESFSNEAAQQDLLNRDARAIHAIVSQAKLKRELINEMLDFSRVQTGRLELRCSEGVDLLGLVRRVVEQQPYDKENHPFILDLGTKPILCDCDSARIEQVINNLLGNAVKYSEAGKPVSIGVTIQPDKPNMVVVWVKDEGVGVEPDQQSHIFDTFYRARTDANAAVDGLGLGLFISREIVNRHGGEIWLQSQPGVGSTFYFSLPL